jgi:RNA polymerase sigma-70 factor (ECF subfamily)
MQVDLTIQKFDTAADVSAGIDNSIQWNEQQLVAEAQRGSVDAFQRLVACYESRVFRLAQRIAHNHEDAEEIMQDAFVQAYKNLSRFRGDSRFYTWLARITINEGLMKMRRQRVHETSIDLETDERFASGELQDWGPNPEQRYSQEELRAILEMVIAQLSPGYRIVFQMRDVEGFSTEETAQALGLTATAVKSRLRRARGQLRQSLNCYFRLWPGVKRLPAEERDLSHFERLGSIRPNTQPAEQQILKQTIQIFGKFECQPSGSI